MGHRRTLNAPQIIETGGAEQSYMTMARAGVSGGSALVDSGSNNMTMVRGPHKRKSRYNDIGSSSNQNTESYHTPGYGVNGLSIGGEGMSRNVRSRTGVDLEPNVAHLSGNSSNHSASSRSSGQSNSVDFGRRSSNIPTMGWNNSLLSPAGHGLTSAAYARFLNNGPDSLNALNSHANASVVNNATSNRNPVPQIANRNVNQSIRGVRSGGASSSNSQAVQLAPSTEGVQAAAGSYSSRTRRTFSAVRLHNNGRNSRNGISSDRFSTGQVLMAANNAALYGSTRNPLDQHRDMRLDVDNMSYEDLLVLGERIGTVSTGLSDNLISECLIEAIFCSSDQEDDERCAICLEEYKHMDDVGNLKCGHDFHVGCIKKWLSMKNLCPICKQSAMDESKMKK